MNKLYVRIRPIFNGCNGKARLPVVAIGVCHTLRFDVSHVSNLVAAQGFVSQFVGSEETSSSVTVTTNDRNSEVLYVGLNRLTRVLGDCNTVMHMYITEALLWQIVVVNVVVSETVQTPHSFWCDQICESWCLFGNVVLVSYIMVAQRDKQICVW